MITLFSVSFAFRARPRAVSILLFLAVIATQADPLHKTWKDYAGGPDSSKYFAADQITKNNVGQLQVAWNYPTGDNNAYLFAPIVVDNLMYVLARDNSLVALDATTGKEVWVHENLRGISARGINYWESKDRKDRRLIFPMNSFLQEIDARTGKTILTFGNDGAVDMRAGLGREQVTRIQSGTPGHVFENLIILGSSTGEGYLSPPGDLRAWDILTGKLVWQFHTVPHPGEFGYNTWPKDAWKYIGGVNTWGEMTVDEKRGIAYFPIGSPTYDFYGADRLGSNLFSDCLLALDARTGKRLWHFQFVHHDLWDYDGVSAPQLLNVVHNGKKVDAVAFAGKTGFVYVFDRVSGEPLWPIEERPVPKSDVPGEQAWPTQPVPSAPPPFGRMTFGVEDLNTYLLSPAERAKWEDTILSARNEGMFTPPSTRNTVQMPSNRGVSNWGSTSANPDKGLMFVISQDIPAILKLATEPPAGGGGRGAAPGTPDVFTQNCQLCHGADRMGSASAGAPPILNISARLKLTDFRLLMQSGKGKMPAFARLNAEDQLALWEFLNAPTGGGGQGGRGGGFGAEPSANPPAPLGGPVVASGGAPGAEAPAAAGRGGGGNQMGGPQYPAGVEAPSVRYYTDYGLHPEMIKPPYTSLVAYDMNKGVIKWRTPLGDDAQTVAEGGANTGVFGNRGGAVVTSTGLIFVAARDGKVRAYDQETGQVLWTTTLPAGSEGVPAMYEVNGRQYLAIPASSAVSSWRGFAFSGSAPADANGTGLKPGYVVFALPQTAAQGK